MNDRHPFSRPVRLNEVGAGLQRLLEPDEAERAAIARWLDMASLEALGAELDLRPSRAGWTLTGRIRAEGAQTCGVTLQPLPVAVDQRFEVRLVEADQAPSGPIDLSFDDDGADVIEDGRIDLGHHAVEQLSLALDPFPRAPGAEFVPPETEAEISPFAALKALKRDPDSGS